MLALDYATIFGAFTAHILDMRALNMLHLVLHQVRIWGRGRVPSPPPILNFEVHMFATAANPLHDVGKISLTPLPTQIMDPYMAGLY